MIFDPLYLLFMAPALILSLIAQGWVKSSFSKYGKVCNRRGITGAEAARRILDSSGLSGVRIEPAQGRGLSDHYDPRTKVLRLSPEVYGKASLASVGVAAHEAGHALQDSRGYAPLKLRSALVPAAQLGSNLAFPLLFLGMFLGVMGMVKLGVIFFSGAVLFQIVTLPVEFNASARAMRGNPVGRRAFRREKSPLGRRADLRRRRDHRRAAARLLSHPIGTPRRQGRLARGTHSFFSR